MGIWFVFQDTTSTKTENFQIFILYIISQVLEGKFSDGIVIALYSKNTSQVKFKFNNNWIPIKKSRLV